MANVVFGKDTISLLSGESVLDGLLREGYELQYGCRAGACQSCMMRADTPPESAQLGLNDAQRELGYFLPCSCFPDNQLEVELGEVLQPRAKAKTLQVDHLTENIVRIRCEKVMDYYAGQYLSVWKDAEIGRSYSIASVPQLDNYIEFQVKRVSNGMFSTWAYDALQVGEELELQGPFGQCIYTEKQPEQTLLLIGIGTGLSPLYGIARQALHSGHKGKIWLILGARKGEDFYLREELQALEKNFSHFSVSRIAQSNESKLSGISIGDIYTSIRECHPDLKQHRIFLCGAASFVQKMKKQCFMSGADMSDILVDSFVPSGAN